MQREEEEREVCEPFFGESFTLDILHFTFHVRFICNGLHYILICKSSLTLLPQMRTRMARSNRDEASTSKIELSSTVHA